jgi:hypothetical protein
VVEPNAVPAGVDDPRGGDAVARLPPGFSPWHAGSALKTRRTTAASKNSELVQKTAIDWNTE